MSDVTQILYTNLVNTKIQISPLPIIFAPMEGITNPRYREIILTHYPDWDYCFTDFLRLPTDNLLRPQQIIHHLGKHIFETQSLRNKTVLQILPTDRTKNQDSARLLQDMKIEWLDLNFGCPSWHVNRHQGGAFLLSRPASIHAIVKDIRKYFHGFLSVKIRIGYHDPNNFLTIIKILEDEGIDLLTIHPRTKDELYFGHSHWEYIFQARNILKIPIIGNGDITSSEKINQILAQTKCQGMMIGRHAVKRPWMAYEYKNKIELDTAKEIKHFFSLIIRYLNNEEIKNQKKTSTLKQLSHFLLYNHSQTRDKIFRCSSYEDIVSLIDQVASEKVSA